MVQIFYLGGITIARLVFFIFYAEPSLALVHPGQRPWHWQRSTGVYASKLIPPISALSTSVRLLASNVDTPSKPQEVSPAADSAPRKKNKHTLAILTMPHSASARIANEAILEAAISVTSDRLSVILRTNTGGSDSPTGEGSSDDAVSLTQLRRYAGEVYSMAWDAALGLDDRESGESEKNMSGEGLLAGPIATGGKLLDLIVYPQNMPNTPPEGWIDLRPDLSCVCSHDSITGWVTSDRYAGGSGRRYASREGDGMGGLQAHVEAVNAERSLKGLEPLEALHVDDWPDGAEVTGDPNVVFLEDDEAYERFQPKNGDDRGEDKSIYEGRIDTGGALLGGALPVAPSSLYSSVCVGGTFDGMHYGHRKLLTLAVSSVQPISGRLLVGVTRDEMLTHKSFAESIPPLEERMAGVLDFVSNLAPGMMNRVRCVPIGDEYGPPGQPRESKAYPGLDCDFDALVLSHETLPTGRKLNTYREEALGLRPLKLLCTQRTEPHGMSSTALRRMRSRRK